MATVKSGKDVKVHTVYKNAKGKRLPGVTTILGILGKPALIHWAWSLGMQQIDYKVFRDDKADIGTLCHAMILAHLRSTDLDTSVYTKRQIDLAETSFLKYLDWEKEHKLQPILLETPLVSERYQYGGTPDNYCILDSRPTYIDYKTGKGIYEEMFFQASAYRNLLIENGNTVDKVYILRFGRDETEGFEVQEILDTTIHFEIFKSCLNIYNLRNQLKKER